MEKGMEEQTASETKEAAEAVNPAESEADRPDGETAADAEAGEVKTEASGESSDEEGCGDGDENWAEGTDSKSWAEKRAAKKQAKLDKKADAYKSQNTSCVPVTIHSQKHVIRSYHCRNIRAHS